MSWFNPTVAPLRMIGAPLTFHAIIAPKFPALTSNLMDGGASEILKDFSFQGKIL